jgi:hypothetical protein
MNQVLPVIVFPFNIDSIPLRPNGCGGRGAGVGHNGHWRQFQDPAAADTKPVLAPVGDHWTKLVVAARSYGGEVLAARDSFV